MSQIFKLVATLVVYVLQAEKHSQNSEILHTAA